MHYNPGAWRLDDATVASLLSREDLASHWIFGRQMTVHPGEAALWMKDGKVVKVVAEGEKMVSGVLDRLKSLFFAGGQLTVIMMDVTDVTLDFRIGVDKEIVFANDPEFYGKLLDAYGRGNEKEEDVTTLVDRYSKDLDSELQKRQAILTRDRESVAFDVRLTFALLPEKGRDLFPLFGAKNALQRYYIENLARQQLEAKLFVPTLALYTGAELRQNLDILAGINKKARKNLEAWFLERGISLKRLAINPALTGEERKAIIAKEKKALESAAADRHEHDLEELNREFDRLVLREKLAAQAVQVKGETDKEKQKILQATFLADQEKKLSAAQMADRIERIRLATKLEAQKKLKELAAFGVKKKWEIEKERMAAEAELEMDKMRVLAEEYRKNKELKAEHKRKELEMRQDEAKKEREHVERLLEMGAQQGVLTDGAIQEALRQQSIRKALDQGESVGRAFGEAQNRRLPDQEIKSLPGQPSISITGQGPMLVNTGGQNDDSKGQRALPDPGDSRSAAPEASYVVTVCPKCGEAVPDGSAFCGVCGYKLDE
ncbi:zinc ribbon domain-containing protein [Desulfatibacillum aliphaticivorans]|uniref:zinc ribbon domain-containing protein n=1 Tax=Desulfatibacillum aliphaticivorans TaxID=218208 RepID=UPI0003F78B17|nr:zinc ribbon domain-containing protein [Desulfatibacillum aliphaticivorans]